MAGEVILIEGKVYYIGYRFGSNVNRFFNQRGREWVQIRKEFGWCMFRGNLHTSTNFSLKDVYDILYLFTILKYVPNVIGKRPCLSPVDNAIDTIPEISRFIFIFIDHFGVPIVFGLRLETLYNQIIKVII